MTRKESEKRIADFTCADSVLTIMYRDGETVAIPISEIEIISLGGNNCVSVGYRKTAKLKLNIISFRSESESVGDLAALL